MIPDYYPDCEIRNALQEVLSIMRNTSCIFPLHNQDYLNLLPEQTVIILNSLPYREDCLDGIHYQLRIVDELKNLHIWTDK